MAGAKTNPRLEAVTEEHSQLNAKGLNGDEVKASFDRTGFKLQLGPKLSEQVSRWLWRGCVLLLLSYLGLSKVTGADAKPQEDLATRVTNLEQGQEKILKALEQLVKKEEP